MGLFVSVCLPRGSALSPAQEFDQESKEEGQSLPIDAPITINSSGSSKSEMSILTDTKEEPPLKMSESNVPMYSFSSSKSTDPGFIDKDELLLLQLEAEYYDPNEGATIIPYDHLRY